MRFNLQAVPKPYPLLCQMQTWEAPIWKMSVLWIAKLVAFKMVQVALEAKGDKMMTQAGPNCDVCGNYILPLVNESINPFSVHGIAQELHACDKCVDTVKTAFDAKDWKSLPQGRLRQVFEDQEKKDVLATSPTVNE